MEGHRKFVVASAISRFTTTGSCRTYYPNHDRFHRLIRARVHLLMRNPWRYVDEIARPGFFGELQVIAPAEHRPPFDDIKDGLHFAMMVRAGTRQRVLPPRFLPTACRRPCAHA